jgi:hypothetical protein
MSFGMNHTVSKQKPKKYFSSLRGKYGQMLERIDPNQRSLAGEKIDRSPAKMLLLKEKLQKQAQKNKRKKLILAGLSVVLSLIILFLLAQLVQFSFMKIHLMSLI